jgi:hypothetical protein
VAARHPIAQLAGLSFEEPDEALYAFPEKYVAGRVAVDGAEVEIHNAHLPPGESRWEIKLHHFEAIRRRADRDTRGPRVLCGDFNGPVERERRGPAERHCPEASRRGAEPLVQGRDEHRRQPGDEGHLP